MTQMKPQFLATLDPAVVLAVVGLDADDLVPGKPIQIVSTGTPQLMVPATRPEALRRARPDPQALSRLIQVTGLSTVPLSARRCARPASPQTRPDSGRRFKSLPRRGRRLTRFVIQLG